MPYLHEVPKGSKIRINLVDGSTRTLTFHRLDGSYSYCTCEQGRVHLSASTPLQKMPDGVYEIQG